MKLELVAIFWVRREDWTRYRAICTDAHLLPTTYEQWFGNAEKALQQFTNRRYQVVRAIVDLDQFVAWCKTKGLDINANARMEYANLIAINQLRARDEDKH